MYILQIDFFCLINNYWQFQFIQASRLVCLIRNLRKMIQSVYTKLIVLFKQLHFPRNCFKIRNYRIDENNLYFVQSPYRPPPKKRRKELMRPLPRAIIKQWLIHDKKKSRGKGNQIQRYCFHQRSGGITVDGARRYVL